MGTCVRVNGRICARMRASCCLRMYVCSLATVQAGSAVNVGMCVDRCIRMCVVMCVGTYVVSDTPLMLPMFLRVECP